MVTLTRPVHAAQGGFLRIKNKKAKKSTIFQNLSCQAEIHMLNCACAAAAEKESLDRLEA